MSTLHIDRVGEGSPVVLLHGSPTTVTYLDPILEALGRQHEVLRVHLPGYGQSTAAPAGAGFAWTTDQLVSALEGIGPLAIVGFSGGSYRALALAVDGRLPIERLALLAPLAHLELEEQQGFREFAGALRARIDLRGMLPGRFLSPARATDPACLADLNAWADAIAEDVLAEELEAFAAGPDLRGDLAALSQDTLLIVGDADVATPAVKARAIEAAMPNARLVEIAGAAHSLLHEAPERTIDLVTAHLAPAR